MKLKWNDCRHSMPLPDVPIEVKRGEKIEEARLDAGGRWMIKAGDEWLRLDDHDDLPTHWRESTRP